MILLEVKKLANKIVLVSTVLTDNKICFFILVGTFTLKTWKIVWLLFRIWVFLVITGCAKKKWNVKFLVWCAGVDVCGRLLVVVVRFLVVCSHLLVVCNLFWSFAGRLLMVCGRLWSFVVVTCFSNFDIETWLREIVMWH